MRIRPGTRSQLLISVLCIRPPCRQRTAAAHFAAAGNHQGSRFVNTIRLYLANEWHVKVRGGCGGCDVCVVGGEGFLCVVARG